MSWLDPAPDPVYLGAQAVWSLPIREAIDAVSQALKSGLDVAANVPRSTVPVSGGQLLLMPGELDELVGVKVVGVAGGAGSSARIQGSFILMEGSTLRPIAIMDGPALTALRTAAVSGAVVENLAPFGPSRVVVFGAGPQAAAHIRALHSVLELTEVVLVSRTIPRAARLVETLRSELGDVVRLGRPSDVSRADLVVCATTAGRPLFPGDWVSAGALVIAIGSHEPDALELEPALLARSQVVVEDPDTAAREAGEVVAAIAEGVLAVSDLVRMADVVTQRVRPSTTSTRVFKGVGMAWQDLVVARRVFERVGACPGERTHADRCSVGSRC